MKVRKINQYFKGVIMYKIAYAFLDWLFTWKDKGVKIVKKTLTVAQYKCAHSIIWCNQLSNNLISIINSLRLLSQNEANETNLKTLYGYSFLPLMMKKVRC